jgi:hypothetical protein
LKDVAKAIHVSEKTLQLWVDFLVEERVIGLEYKFMNPYIFLNEEEKQKKEQKEITLNTFREKFYQNALKKKIPEDQIPELWERHLRTHLEKLKPFFILEAKKQNFKNADPEELFNNYLTKILASKKDVAKEEKTNNNGPEKNLQSQNTKPEKNSALNNEGRNEKNQNGSGVSR